MASNQQRQRIQHGQRTQHDAFLELSSLEPIEARESQEPRQVQLDLGSAAEVDGEPRATLAQTRSAQTRSRHSRESFGAQRLARARITRDRRPINESSHLVAARRLSKAIRRAPNRAEEARIGRMVCGHLIALLEETDKEQRAQLG